MKEVRWRVTLARDDKGAYNINMKLMLTGGHLAPALAIIEELAKQKNATPDLIFVGRKYAIDSEQTLSLEYKEIIKRNIPFITLQSGRFSRLLNWHSVKSLLKIPGGFINAYLIVSREKPEAVMTFGGYIGLPIAFWSYLFHIPVYTHEQTISPGLANRIIARFSRKVYLSFDEAAKFFPAGKTTVTGNPVRMAVLKIDKKPFAIVKSQPVIYITGGSLGSHSINQIIKEIIVKLLNRYIVIHQTGETKEYHDYEDLLKIKDRLPKELANRYYLVKHFFDDELGYVFHTADLVIGRAGANTFFELTALNKPAIFIPLPWSANGEQELQARIFSEAGTGEVFHQTDDSRTLLILVDKISTNINRYRTNFHSLHQLYKKNAAEYIVNEIFTQA